MNLAQPVEIELDFGKHGWGRCQLRAGDEQFLISGMSYTTDVLGDLVRAALLAAAGADRAQCSFDGEPYEQRLIASREWCLKRSTQIFTLRVLGFRDICAHEPDEMGDELWRVECLADEFARAVERAAVEIGPGGYNWLDNPFPHRAVVALSAALQLPEDKPNG